MQPTAENLQLRERFLSTRYKSMLSSRNDSGTDPFTMTREFPQTFKVGECRVHSTNKVAFRIQLYWRDDQQTVQQEIIASAIKENDSWVVDNVDSKKD